MGEKLPYYMVYPLPYCFDDDRLERRDYEYMKSLYPDTVKRILPYVEEECDRLEYPCSMMYDEYPDRLQLRLMCSRIYKKIEEQGKEEKVSDMETVFPGIESGLVEVLAYQELQRRRKEQRRGRKRFY